jgi:hypothetical protein
LGSDAADTFEERVMEELKPAPCPFCNADMLANTDVKDLYVRRYGAYYMHPESPYCILGHFEISPSEITAWNRRASLVQGTEATAGGGATDGVRVPDGSQQ